MTQRTRHPHQPAADELRTLMADYGPLVRAVAHRYVRGADADDVVQETWIAYLRFAHQVTDQRRLGAWLRTVATRAAYRQAAKAAREQPTRDDDLGAWGLHEDDACIELEQRERGHAVRRAAGRLRHHERDLLLLLIDERGFSYQEISARSGRPVGSLGPTRDRIVRQLRVDHDVRRWEDEPAVA